MRTIIALALAGGALAALTACTPDTAVSEKQPSPTVTKSSASGAGGGSTEAAWRWIDWGKATHETIGDCPTGDDIDFYRTEVESVTYADLSGDGRTEAVVAAACQSTTASNAVRVFVYDGAQRSEPYRLLLTVGEQDYFKAVDLKAAERTLTVTAAALSENAARCCPDVIITEKWHWTDGEFDRTSRAIQRVKTG